MSLFDENSLLPPDQEEPSSQSPAEPSPGAAQPPVTPAELPLAGDPISLAATVPAPVPSYKASLPADLRISWSWLHLVVFSSFIVVSFFIVQISFMVYYAAPLSHLSDKKDFERFALSKPVFAVGSMVLLYGLVLLFLYVTLSVLPGLPFWRTLGWRRITRPNGGRPRSPWLFFFAGCGLSLAVLVATYKIQPPEDVPIEELFHYKNTAMLFMAMAFCGAARRRNRISRLSLPAVCKIFRRCHQRGPHRRPFRIDARRPARLDLEPRFRARHGRHHLYICSRTHRLRLRQLFASPWLQLHDRR